jgi:hypothetical protein
LVHSGYFSANSKLEVGVVVFPFRIFDFSEPCLTRIFLSRHSYLISESTCRLVSTFSSTAPHNTFATSWLPTLHFLDVHVQIQNASRFRSL